MFIRCSSPPSVAVRGLTGAYFGSASANLLFPIPPYPPLDCDVCADDFVGGKGGKGESKFEESSSGDGGRLCNGLVALRIGFPNGD